MKNKIRVHIIPEYGDDFRPHSSAYIRLLRPLFHPGLQGYIQTTSSYYFLPEAVDMVIMDRFWRPDINLDLAKKIVMDIRRTGAKFVYSFDDDFYTLRQFRSDFPTPRHIEVFDYFLTEADYLLVTTDFLKTEYQKWNKKVKVLNNLLDEQLIVARSNRLKKKENNIIKIGYMGTLTHSSDLDLVVPALNRLKDNVSKPFVFELIGIADQNILSKKMGNFPFRLVPMVEQVNEYPLFMLWYTGSIDWDIAIAPLDDNVFNNSKSYIKYLDYSAIKSAGIYSNVLPYKTVIKNGQNGMIASNPDEWFSALIELINNDEIRSEIAYEAEKDLFSNFVINKNVDLIINTIENMLT